MFCINCGKQIPDESAFCQYCGSAVNAVPQAPQQQVVAPMPAAPQYMPAPQPMAPQQATPQYAAPAPQAAPQYAPMPQMAPRTYLTEERSGRKSQTGQCGILVCGDHE